MAPLTPEEEALAKVLQEKMQEAASAALSTDVVELLTSGQLESVLNALDLGTMADDWTDIARILQHAGEAAGGSVMASVASVLAERVDMTWHPPKGAIDIAFDVVDENVVRRAQTRSAELVVQISESMRDTIRGQIVNAVRGGATPQQTARTLARIIPLHDRYARAVLRYERNAVSEYIKGGMDASEAILKAGVKADKYAAKLTRLRARTIARTEIMTASNHGQYTGYQAAQQAGMMTPPESGRYMVTKEWITAADERTCPTCRPLNGMQVDFNEPFPTGDLVPPAHPNCRCSFNVIDNLADAVFGYEEVA